MADLRKGPPVSIPARHGPALIAHMGGNTPAAARSAIEGVADFVEVDLWAHRGRLEARHERAMYPVPVWFEKWTFRRAPRQPFTLPALLVEAADRTGVFLDLKNSVPEAADLVRNALDEAGPGLPPVAASSQRWSILRRLRQVVPAVALFYSIDVPEKLDLFLSVADRDGEPDGVSCRHSLLSADAVCELRRRGLKVVAWTVDDLDRAAELVSWGVDGITTHRVADMRRHLGIER